METVWIRESKNGFILGRLTELLSNEAVVTPNDPKYPKMTCSFDDIFQAGDPNKEVNDNCEMMFLNEATLLNNIKRLYNNDKIYSYVANILIAVNPYKNIPNLYTPKMIQNYHGKYIGQLPPHIFAIADKAARDVKVLKQSQSIIVSGESGAGKTESTKHLLRFLCDSHGKSSAGPIETNILEANPVLEAFGNAKTTRNNNSSRFGKFIEIHFDETFNVVGGFISHYLLEKSRICSTTGDERNYHIFYILLGGAPEKLKTNLNLTQPDNYHYLNRGCTQYFTKPSSDKKLFPNRISSAHSKKGPLRDSVMDDVEYFNILDKSLTTIGLSENEKMEIYVVVAAVLHLGNVQFEEAEEDSRGGCVITSNSRASLQIAAKFLGIDENRLSQVLSYRSMQSNKGVNRGTLIMVPLKIHEANSARDALAKAIYSKLFDYIVERINRSIPFQSSSYYIGVLDIAGFEFFTVNSFEQFCINYCNEKLQHFFNEKILKYEIELFSREAIEIPEINYTDNQDCIDMIEKPKIGIISQLDEESKMPKPSYKHFTTEVHAKWAGHLRLDIPRKSKLQAHRNIMDDEGFLVKHFAGAVCYKTVDFIEKNNDALHESLEGIIKESNNKLIRSFFENYEHALKGKLTFISLGTKFKSQLNVLLEKLQDNGTNFIRCIKPNANMTEGEFDGPLSLAQLKSSGVIHALELMKHGYPSRSPFAELHSAYSGYFPEELKKLRPKIFSEALLNGVDLKPDDYKFGITRVFFKLGKLSTLDNIVRSDSGQLQDVIKRAKKWLSKLRWSQTQFGILAALKFQNIFLARKKAAVEIQRHVKGYLTWKNQQPRIKGYKKFKDLNKNVQQLEMIGLEIKNNKNLEIQNIEKIKNEIEASILKIKREKKIKPNKIEEMYNSLASRVNRQIKDLRKKVEDEKRFGEQGKLDVIQEEMEKENMLKEEEKKKEFEREENIRRRSIFSVRKKQEIQEKKKQEELDKLKILKLQAEIEKLAAEEQHLREMLEQERQDHDIALRLSKETNSRVDNNLQFKNRLEALKKQKLSLNGIGKYDLSNWKYFELRNILVSTPSDTELLEACKYEFHRRLKIYHEWRTKNLGNHFKHQDRFERAPLPFSKNSRTPTKIRFKDEVINNNDNKDRYFRVAFRKSGTKDKSQRGYWYAHFKGQYVVRQFHLWYNKPPCLLIAGRDDLQMCELTLEETGLMRKKNTEITEKEFTKEWEKYGGKPLTT